MSRGRIPARAALIHDLAGYGRCSLTIALPVLAACGIECVPIPTALLSSHTGGLPGATFYNLTDTMQPAAAQYAQLGLHFDAVYTGFLGSAGQIDVVRRMLPQLRASGTRLLVDPVLGDHGRLYRTVTPALAQNMRMLCREADLITPNLTEAGCLLQEPVEDACTPEQAAGLAKRLSDLGPETVVLTGVQTKNQIGACVFCRSRGAAFAGAARIPGAFHGTGDLFASVLLGQLLRGQNAVQAAQTAAGFVSRCVAETVAAGGDERGGLCFEPLLGLLCPPVAPENGAAGASVHSCPPEA